MRFVTYVVLMMCIAIAAYMFGMQSPAMAIIAAQGGAPFDIGTFIVDMLEKITGDLFLLGLLGAAATIGIISIMTGFGAMYIIPTIILAIVANLFVFPISDVIGGCTASAAAVSCLYGDLSLILMLILNTLGILAVLNFVRGGT